MNAILTKISAILLTIAGILAVYRMTGPTFSSAPTGIKSVIATTSSMTVFYSTSKSPQVFGPALLFSANTSCTARVISTVGSSIMLYFSTTTIGPTSATGTANVNSALGHVQAASTTAVYDSGLYGCENVGAYSDGTSTITVTEFR